MGGYGAMRYALAHPELFGAAIVLSPAVYFPLPPRDSSTREFGAFGNGSVRFDEAIYQEKNYPATLPAFRATELPLVHIKDGKLSNQPGVTWGEEVPFGHGQVGPQRFFNALHDVDYTGPLVIEREAGNNRLADVRTAIETIRANL